MPSANWWSVHQTRVTYFMSLNYRIFPVFCAIASLLVMPLSHGGIEIDGVLDEPEWAQATEFKDFVFNSPYAKIASELMSAKKINLVMDNWFLRESGSKSSTPFHHDVSYFDMEGTMCVLWLPLQATKKNEGVVWVKGSHLWNKLFLRVLFKDGHKVEGKECVIDGKKYELPPDILGNKDKYEFLKWDCEIGDCVIFDMRTLHGTLSSSIPKKTLSRYTLRVAKEDAKISYVGDWTSYNYRKSMQDSGYKNGDPLGGKMFPLLYESP